MKTWDLAKDPALVKSPEDATHPERVTFVGIRLRALIDATPTLETTTDVNAIGAVKTQLNTELGNAKTAVDVVVTRMGSYENATPTKLLRLDSASIDPALLQKYVKIGFLKATTIQALKDKRQALIRTLAWSATAAHPQLQAATRNEDLIEVVERRLRLVERMLYEVGINLHKLKDRAIKVTPTGPWGTMRAGSSSIRGSGESSSVLSVSQRREQVPARGPG